MVDWLRCNRWAGRLGRILVGVRRGFPSMGRLLAWLSILGLVALSFLSGAAVLYLDIPPAEYLKKAFSGGVAWSEREFPNDSDIDTSFHERTSSLVSADQPGLTFDGYTLWTTSHSSRATLIDMRGNVVHQWELPFSKVWPQAPHIRRLRQLPDDRVHWFRCHLYPNGDLLAIYHARGDTPYGYGLVKMDSESNVLWSYAENVHHDLDVAEDGTIYTLAHRFTRTPTAVVSSATELHLADDLIVLSGDGIPIKKIPIYESFAGTPYSPILGTLDRQNLKNRPAGSESPVEALLGVDADAGQFQPNPHGYPSGDLLHTNSVKSLSRKFAPRFPRFRAGQVLVSMRNLDAIAVIDIEKSAVVWAVRGPWRRQHDAEFLDNGHMLLYDNLGSLAQTAHPRVRSAKPIGPVVLRE